MTPVEAVPGRVEAAIDALVELLELADEHPDAAALACRTMPPDVMVMIGEYLEASVGGALTNSQIRNEALTWLEVALAGWPFDSDIARTLVATFVELAGLPADPAPEITGPAVRTPIERALQAAIADPTARPALWKALWYGTIFLPVAGVDFDADDAAAFRFVALDIGGEPTILGFTTEERLDLVTPDEPVGRVEPTGEELARLWPEDHWLVLNPGFDLSTVLSPAEIRGLPGGPTVFVPEDLQGTVEAPTTEEHQLRALQEARRSVTGISALHWAVVRPDQAGAKPRDVLVIDVEADGKPLSVLAAFIEAAASSGFENAVVLLADPGNEASLCSMVRSSGLGLG